jgi:mRNA-degrading endonuclease RelE of RelBE toxin-antitoxin system
MSYEIITSGKFDRELKRLSKKHKSLKQDYASFLDLLESDPTQGIPLGKDCYKIRLAIASKGKGKRGGGRVITCVKIIQETVYLLAIYDKADQETVSDTDIDQMLAEAGLTAADKN